MNPLKASVGLPKFELIQATHVTPAIDEILAVNTKLLEHLIQDDAVPTWDNFVMPMEDANELLSCAWGPVSHLNSVMNTDELREAYNENLPKITQYYAEMAQNLSLYEKYKNLKESEAFGSMSISQKKIIANELRDFRLGGAELASAEKERFLEIQEQLSKCASQFEENLLDATNAFGLIISDKSELAGLPDDVLQSASELAEKESKKGWKLTLHAPSFIPVMQYAEDRALRETLYKAYVTRASEHEPAQWDNSNLITQIVSLRHEAAVMLGFDNYADLSLATKMADTQQQVESFLMSLAQRARPSAEADLAELKLYAKTKLGINELQAWDISFASEKLRMEKYAYSDQELKQYFPEEQVLQGLFKLLTSLYGLTVSLATAQVWHKDVRFYAIKNQRGDLIGQFYLDLYAREHKRGGAWMDDALARRRKGAEIQIPVAYLTCNFSPPVGNKPALFTHDEVITLFHEFGHGLHHMLTQVEELGVSGISGVEWDAVELPSQFMENFCWEWDVLQHMTQHVDTGEALPRKLFDKMLAAKNFQSGLQTLRQVEFSLFDLRLHSGIDIHKTSALQVLKQVRESVAVITPPDYNRFPNNFSHIFAGGYAAGYYSYKWAEVLSADAYSLFEEHGVLSAEIGQKFWAEVLSVGGSRPALESFIAFRGREPSIDALLRHNGMS
ncbi:M3 family metallopeptidase [Sulfuriferula nivalis]|uniref:oligopeptidase A n=1 Tax=Sulfuriferula nivalis TaxID=2675298 RepID=A0A809RZ17_9PROT|nr:M3 family metallopeptidase [Sulfuriferula nivalis]BBO99447.1 oligopeptidase A [Sulfuriferula nivalis]